MSYTKGEWVINSKASRNVRCGNITIASCSSGQSGELEDEEIANAQLIAAAPDLLEALQEFLNVINRSDTAMLHYGEAIALGSAAINKATKTN